MPASHLFEVGRAIDQRNSVPTEAARVLIYEADHECGARNAETTVRAGEGMCV